MTQAEAHVIGLDDANYAEWSCNACDKIVRGDHDKASVKHVILIL